MISSTKFDSSGAGAETRILNHQLASSNKSIGPKTIELIAQPFDEHDGSTTSALSANQQLKQFKTNSHTSDNDVERCRTITSLPTPDSAQHAESVDSDHDEDKMKTSEVVDGDQKEIVHDSSLESTSSGIGQHDKSSKSSIQPVIKKKRRIEETIIDGFAICAFRTWEDLQDELNEKIASKISNSAPANTITSVGSPNKNHKSPIKQKTSTSKISNGTSSTSASKKDKKEKKVKKEKKEKNERSDERDKKEKNKKKLIPNANISNPDTENNGQNNDPNLSQQHTSNISDLERGNLRKALEAKEMAEKRLSSLQKKLSKEKMAHLRESNHDGKSSNGCSSQDNPNAMPHHDHLSKMDQSGALKSEPLNDPAAQASRATPYSPYDIESNLNRPYPSPNLQFPTLNSHLAQQQEQKFAQYYQSQHAPNGPAVNPRKSPYAPLSQNPQQPHLGSTMDQRQANPPTTYNRSSQQSQQTRQQQAPPSTSLPQNASNLYHTHLNQQHAKDTGSSAIPNANLYNQYHHNANMGYTQSPYHPASMSSHLHNPHPMSAYPPQHNPHASSMVSSMSMSALPSPYSSPYIINETTISRQTSIIPSTMDHMTTAAAAAAAAAAASRSFGHPALFHSPMNPYASANASAAAAAAAAAASASHGPPQHPLMSYYHPLPPTERSFIEFARNYTNPSHMSGYPGLMGSLPTAQPPMPSSSAPVPPAPGAPPLPQPAPSQPSRAQPPLLPSQPPPPPPPHLQASSGSSLTANPYSFDRWPRMSPFDYQQQQRAASRYSSSLYPSSNPSLPASYTSAYQHHQYPASSLRPPHFPSGLFPPPF